MDPVKYIEEVSRLCGPSGHEQETSEWYRARFAPLADSVTVDNLYNVIAFKKATRPMPDGSPAPKVMLAAHQDEIALIVTAILPDGTLRMGEIGGVDPRILPAAEVRVHAAGGIIPGVVECVHPSLLSKEKDGAYRRDDLFVDCGLTGGEAKARVKIGDLITFNVPAVKLLNGRVAAKTMDDRACIGCLIEAAERLRNMSHLCDVYFVATAQEEVGSKGARVASYAIEPDLAIALDVTHASLPSSKPDTTVPLDAAAVSCGPTIQPKLLARLEKTAADHGVKINKELAANWTYTDADDIQDSHGGVPCLLIDLPLKYMHTSVETLDTRALTECGRLLAHFLGDLDERWADDLWI